MIGEWLAATNPLSEAEICFLLKYFNDLQDKENRDAMKALNGFDSLKSGRDVSKNTLRRTLRRRVSMTVMRQKMRKLQDYSLPCQTDNFRFLRAINDCCNSPIIGLRRSVRQKVRIICFARLLEDRY